MKCFIVDDDLTSRKTLLKLCEKIEFLEVVKEFDNATDALIHTQNESIDLLFLDIHMPDLTGIDMVRNASNLPQIIFTTSDAGFAVEAFQYNVTDYLVKPLNYPRFLQAVTKAKERWEKPKASGEEAPVAQEVAPPNDIFIKVDSRFVKVALDDILFVEAQGDYVTFKTAKKSYLVYSTLKHVGQKLPEGQFLKIHRSYIVNLQHIQDIEDFTLVIGDSVIPISRNNKPVLMERLNLI